MSATYSNQNILPKLPVARLEDTHKKLLQAVAPLVDSSTLEATRQTATAFFADNAPGPALQKKLQEWEQNLTRSWLKPFWDALYLDSRAPLHTSSNFALLLETDRLPQGQNMIKRTAWLMQAAARFYIELQQEKIPPESIRGTPLDMSQYAAFFASMRIPGTPGDRLHISSDLQHPLHVCVALRGHLYRLEVTNAAGLPYSTKSLADALQQLLDNTPKGGPDVGIYTTAERDSAAQLHHQLMQSATNNGSYQQLRNALFLLVLDEHSQDKQASLHNLLLDGHNRWYDKPIQLVLGAEGNLGINIEHSGIDGTTALAILDCLLQHQAEQDASNEPASCQPLNWELDANLQKQLQQLQEHNRQTTANYSLHIEPFTEFGGDAIKQLGFSPDAFFHMALQVAQYRTFGRLRSTYESVSMRAFHEGRTECLRPSRSENLQLAMAMTEGSHSAQELLELMQQAGHAHSSEMRQAQQGLGAERHLYGLQQIQARFGQELGVPELPELFHDPGYLALRHDFLSTSNMSSPLVHSCAFGPVVEDGYGIFYLLLADRIVINLCSYRRNADSASELVRQLVQALQDLRSIVLAANAERSVQ